MLKNVSIIIPVAPNEHAHLALVEQLKGCGAEIIISREGSRPEGLNLGAKKATNEFLWFLHADSELSSDFFSALEKAIKNNANDLSYFYLSYKEGGLAHLNAIGANIRSVLFDLPYGDQGFFIKKKLFDEIGGYPDVAYGEDVFFLRRAKKKGIKLNLIKYYLKTSARKYHDVGWFKLTFIRQIQIYKLLREKL